MSELRLGDILDDHCIKCRRLTNHAIVSIVDGNVAKVRCRSCYHDHDYLFEIAPPSKKDIKKAELAAAAKAEAGEVVAEDVVGEVEEAAVTVAVPATKAARGKKA